MGCLWNKILREGAGARAGWYEMECPLFILFYQELFEELPTPM